MPSAWIETRNRDGLTRYRVRFRIPGGIVGRYGGSFHNRDEATERLKWVRRELSAMRLPDINRLTKRRPPKIRDQKQKDLDRIYMDARKLSQQISMARSQYPSQVNKLLGQAEGLTMQATDLVYDAWGKNQL
jgi:hypothetical protein